MKKNLIIMILTAILTTTACGKKVGTNDSESSSSIENSTTVSATTIRTTVASSSSATTAVTTKAKEEKASKNPPAEVILTAADTVEVYKDMTISEFITDTNAELCDADKPIDVSELGEKKIKVKFTYDGKLYEKELKYNVVDTTEPVLLNSGWEPYTIVDQPFDLNSMVGFVDNYDRSPALTYEGVVDTSMVGSYPITATVTDNSGNSTSWDMTVLVLTEKPQPQDNNTRVSFSDFMSYYCYDNVSYGIDVSAWQTNVDYNAVKNEGCEFVIMRMGYCYDQIKMDDYYLQNMENATAAGLDVGVYFYTTANTEEKVREQARWILEQLDGRSLDYPIAFDWESWGQFQQYGMNVHDLNELFEIFCEEIEKGGYTAMLYSSKNFLNNFWENENNRPVWLAHYVDETDYDGLFAIWQASAYGRIAGIEGDVDMNIRIKDMPLN